MHFPRNRTRWDKYMLQDISNYNFYGRSELVRLRGKYTVQTAHCALGESTINHIQIQTVPSHYEHRPQEMTPIVAETL